MSEIKAANPLPRHIAIIMDGNGRWAKERGQARLFGHNAGMKSLREIVRCCSDMGIEYLTVYAFSTENWKRPLEEVSGIFKLLVKYVGSDLDELNENNVRLCFLGDVSAIPEDSRKAVELAVSSTAENTGLRFNIAVNYGGRAEIVMAARKLAGLVSEGKLSPEDIDEAQISSGLYTAGMPDPELLIRTGGDSRTSNFLTWQSVYSEIMITDCYWPDFTPEILKACIDKYMGIDRRFGGIK